MAMFTKQIRLVGKHAYIMQKYCRDKGGESSVPYFLNNHEGKQIEAFIFETKIHCYMCAAMFGLLKGMTSEPDNGKEYSNYTSTIFAEIIGKERPNLERIYHHIILAESDDKSADSRVKAAFSMVPEELVAIETKRFENYVRGGLEYIDSVFSNCTNFETFCDSLYDLLAEISPED